MTRTRALDSESALPSSSTSTSTSTSSKPWTQDPTPNPSLSSLITELDPIMVYRALYPGTRLPTRTVTVTVAAGLPGPQAP
eukprot:1786449-Rhodomonas_salina.1